MLEILGGAFIILLVLIIIAFVISMMRSIGNELNIKNAVKYIISKGCCVSCNSIHISKNRHGEYVIYLFNHKDEKEEFFDKDDDAVDRFVQLTEDKLCN
jgi:uncharacterized membrane protein YvbJ